MTYLLFFVLFCQNANFSCSMNRIQSLSIRMICKWSCFKFMWLGNPRWPSAAVIKNSKNMKMTILKNIWMNSDQYYVTKVHSWSYYNSSEIDYPKRLPLPLLKIAKKKWNNVNSLTVEKQTTKFSSANFKKILSPSYIILRIQRLEGKQSSPRSTL